MARAEQPVGASEAPTGTDVRASDATTADTGLPPTSALAPTTGPTVVIEVHRTVYVDEFGNPVDPPVITSMPVVRADGAGLPRPQATAAGRPSSTPTAVTSTTAATVPQTTVRTPPPAPSCSGSNCP